LDLSRIEFLHKEGQTLSEKKKLRRDNYIKQKKLKDDCTFQPNLNQKLRQNTTLNQDLGNID